MGIEELLINAKENYNYMQDSVRTLRREGYWPFTNIDIEEDLKYHLQVFIINIIAQDSIVSDKERTIFNYILDYDMEGDDFFEHVKLALSKCQKLLYTDHLPYYLESAVKYDLNNGLYLSRILVDSLKLIGLYVAAADGETSEDELSFITALNNLHNNMLDIQGVVKIPDSKLDNTPVNTQKITTLNNHMQEDISLEELMDQLNKLIGLDIVKREVGNLVNLIRVRNMRTSQGLSVAPMSFHLIFTGNPGTGKTTVARLLSNIYRELGLLQEGQLTEVDRSGLVAAYMGQTSLKVKDVVDKALGGVLFIDEAYSLVSGRHETDYGKEAIDTLLKLMEDNRHNLIVIAAGYPAPMEDFLESNPGVRSRFNKYIQFEDYSPDELYDIFVSMCHQSEYVLTNSAASCTKSLFTNLHNQKDETFGNARTVRNVFEQTISNQANRIISMQNPGKSDLVTIDAKDLPDINSIRSI
jgi:hypothetical protein